MKYILILALTFLYVQAEVEKKQMYAQVTSQTADLYHLPTKDGSKKLNFFKKGDMLPVEYCDKDSWCKISNGYVQKGLLKIPAPILRNVVVMPKYKTEIIKEVQSEPKVVLTPKLTPLVMDNTAFKPQMYAKIRSNNADLYNIPNQDSQKQVNYFTKGDTIGIAYCDKSRWCKTTNGYVKKDFLTMLDPLNKSITPIPNSVASVHDNSAMYARLVPSKANLYYKPNLNAKKSIDYFQKGDRVKIYYCDNDEWCKTINGYVRQDDILMPKALMLEARQNYKFAPIVHQRSLSTRNVDNLEKRMVITKTKYIQVVEDMGEYENYFKNDSAKVVFTRSK